MTLSVALRIIAGLIAMAAAGGSFAALPIARARALSLRSHDHKVFVPD